MRILHLPTEVAGQVGIVADAQRRRGHDARMLSPTHAFGYPWPIDYRLPTTGTGLRALPSRIAAAARAGVGFDVYHYHFASALLPGQLDVRLLNHLGRRVVVEFYGSDVRLPETEARRNPYFSNVLGSSESANRRKLARWARLTGGEVVIADHSFNLFLRPYFDTIHVIGQRIDCSRFLPAYPSADPARPLRIVHAPSRPAFKGTPFLEAAIGNLRAKGLQVDYQRAHGLSNEGALSLLRSADIVVDQLCAGSHGIVTCEAMALGKPVVCFILEELQEGFPRGFPVVSANPDTIEDVLEQLLSSPGQLHALGRSGRAYVERVHDVDRIAGVLDRIYTRQFTRPRDSMIEWRGFVGEPGGPPAC